MKKLKTKICNICKKRRPVGVFNFSDKKRLPGKRRGACSKCLYNKFPPQKKWTKEETRAANLWQLYKITVADWEKLFIKQRRACACCKRKRPSSKKGWCTDHVVRDGRTKVRGILCSNCNILLGLALESVRILKAAIRYLEVHARD